MNNDKNNKTNGTILHGNHAKIDPKKKVIPQFGNCVFNDFGAGVHSAKHDRYGRAYHRLDDNADFDVNEVESIRL